MNKYIARQYGESVIPVKMKSSYISLNSSLINSDDKPSITVKYSKKLVPLLFYWRSVTVLTSTLNAKIPVGTFASAFSTYANGKGLKHKLNGNKLEISIDKIPQSFTLNDDYTLIIPIVAKISVERIWFSPEKNDLVLSYKITGDSTGEKSGTIMVADANKIQRLKFLQSKKNATIEYLNQYDDNIKAMAKNAVEQIISEL